MSAELDHGDSSDAIGAALEQTDEVIAIFDAFLRIAKLESGQSDKTFAPVPLGDLAQQMIDIYEPVVEDSGRDLTLRLVTPAIVSGDQVLLVQMLANLIENAIRHTPQGTALTLIAQGRNTAST